MLIRLMPDRDYDIKPEEIPGYSLKNGLALYKRGNGPLVFLMPYPHASTYRPVADSRLSELICSAGYSIISFDPPGFCNSVRNPDFSLDEMISCSLECLDFFKVNIPLPFIGHSMGSFCALAFCIQHPGKVLNLTMTGAASGWDSVRKSGIHKSFRFYEKDYWRSRYYGARIILGMDNLAIHKKLDNLNAYHSFVDKSFFAENQLQDGDHRLPAPLRSRWLKMLGKYNYDNQLSEVKCPVLILNGRYDRITPLSIALGIQNGITNARLKILEHSGHSPFIEEPRLFMTCLEEFWKQNEK